MDVEEKLYCRLCAEQKQSNKLLDLRKDTEKCVEINKKLQALNVVFVDVTSQNMLPKTVCFVCCDSLNKASEFLHKLKQAQSILSTIFTVNTSNNINAQEEDQVLDIILSPCPKLDEEQVKIKEEDLPLMKLKQNMTSVSAFSNTTSKSLIPIYPIKVEVKEESNDSTGVEDNIEPQESQLMDENYDSGMNMQVLLDAAIGDLPMTQNVTLYAKEVPILTKKSIKKWKDYPWICVHCNNEFTNINMLKIHSKEVHKCCPTYMCTDCGDERCYEFEIFVSHVRKHRKSLRNVCYYCDIKTDNMIEHVRSHFTKSKLACHICGDILKNETSLKRHKKLYTRRAMKPRRKPGTPITKEDLTCKLCGKIYKSLNSLRDHTKLHNADRKRNYTCDRCGKTFYNKGTLTTHIMSHDKIRPHICRICKKSFLFPNMLRRHVEMHSGIKPFSCEQCGRCFRLQYQLNQHKIVHSDSLPYVCQYCSKAFRYKQILQSHERQHTGAKPYSCQICSMEFTNWSNYNKHMKRRHNTDTSKKKITPEGVFPVNPETGQMIRIEDPVGTEKWKKEIMVPGKRGKKKVIKQEKST